MSFLNKRGVGSIVDIACPQTLQPWPEAQALGSAQETPQGQEGGAAVGEARRRQDPLARHHHHTRDGRLHGRRAQRQDLQPGGDQGRDDRPLLGRVQLVVQASQAR